MVDRLTDDGLEEIEIRLLLEGVERRYGFDFRDYAPASLRRRIWNIVRSEQLKTISALQERVLRDSGCLERFVIGVTVNVSSMFRDPGFFLAFRQKALPFLRTYPFIRIWQAGCSMGEEVYSLAILLHEEGLYDRCLIYATDMNEAVLRHAKTGIYPLDLMQKYTSNYIQAGGKASFSEYYTAAHAGAIFRPFLREKMVFSPHNLVTDGGFNEFNVILCRNVMIYFNRALQQRVHKLFYESLSMFGILGLGSRETLRFSPLEKSYEHVDDGQKLYRRIN